MKNNRFRVSLPLTLLAFGASACDGGQRPMGDVIFAIQAEDTITSGLASGMGEEDIVDGWSVSFDQYIATFGLIHLVPASGGTDFMVQPRLVIDLTTVPETGHIVRMGALPEGRYSFEYTMPVAEADMTRDASVPQADFDRMVAEGCSYLIRGAATNGARTIDFDLCLDAEAAYECSSTEGMEGIVVSAGSTTTFLTVHGDHLFFDGFPGGEEGTVVRRGSWLALVDDATGGDGTIDRADLEATPISVLPSTEYNLAGAPTVEGAAITTMALYARAQLSTQGHLNGEGECLANGVGHMHLSVGL